MEEDSVLKLPWWNSFDFSTWKMNPWGRNLLIEECEERIASTPLTKTLLDDFWDYHISYASGNCTGFFLMPTFEPWKFILLYNSSSAEVPQGVIHEFSHGIYRINFFLARGKQQHLESEELIERGTQRFYRENETYAKDLVRTITE